MFRYDMPKGVLQLNLLQIFSTVGFAVLLSTLNLYLQSKGMPIKEVNTLTASFFALNFLLHFLGGSLGGGYFSYRSLLVLSLLLQVVGLASIASASLTIILLGMAFFITGSGLNVSCINMMITQRFAVSDMRRRTAFSVNYACMNVGFLASGIVANIFQSANNYSGLFLFTVISLLIALVLHFFAWKHLPDVGTFYVTRYKNYMSARFIGAGIVISCFILVLYLMYHPNLASTLIYVFFIAGFIYILSIIIRQPIALRYKAFAYITLVGSSCVFAFIQGLMSTALQNFVNYNTDKTLFGIPLQSAGVNSFESIGVIIFSLILASLVRRRQENNKKAFPAGYLIATGLSFNIFAFLMIPLGILFASNMGLTPLIFPVSLLIFAALAEVLVNAVNFSLAGELVPQLYQGLFTGYLFLNIAVGNNLAGPFSNLILGKYDHLANVAANQTNPMYFSMFLVLAIAAALIAGLYLMLSKWINRVTVN